MVVTSATRRFLDARARSSASARTTGKIARIFLRFQVVPSRAPRSRPVSTALHPVRFSRRVVNSLCRLAKPVSPSPEAFHNRAANQGFLFAVLATPSFTEGRAIFFAGDVVFLLRLLTFTRFALAGAGTEGPALAAL